MSFPVFLLLKLNVLKPCRVIVYNERHKHFELQAIDVEVDQLQSLHNIT